MSRLYHVESQPVVMYKMKESYHRRTEHGLKL